VWESNRNSTLYPKGHRRSSRACLNQKQMTSRAIPESTVSLQGMQPLYSHIFRWARLWLVQTGTLSQCWLNRPMLKKIIPKLWYNEYSLVGIRGFVFYACRKESVKIYGRTKLQNVFIRRHDGHVGVPKEFLAFTKWFACKHFLWHAQRP